MKKINFLLLVVSLLSVSSCKKSVQQSITEKNCVNLTLAPILVASASSTPQYIACGKGGAIDASVAVFNVKTNVPIVVTEIKCAQESQFNSMTNIKTNGVSSPFVNSIAWISNLNIPGPAAGNGINIEIKDSYTDVGVIGLPSGTLVKKKLIYIKYTTGGVTGVLNCDIPANTMTLVGSKPVPVVSSIPQSGLLLNGMNKVFSLNVTADPKGDIGQNQIQVSVNSSGVTGFSLTNLQVKVGNTVIPGSNVTWNAGGVMVVTLPNYLISAGTTTTFDVYATVNGTSSGSPSIQSILSPGGFKWTDKAGSGNISAETGVLVYNFPQNSYFLQQ